MTKILITGAGGPAAVSLIKALKGASRELFVADMDPNAAGLYMVPSRRRALLPAGKDAMFIHKLHKLCIDWQIDVLIPTVDVELLPIAKERRLFEQFGTKVMLASRVALGLCLDKWALAQCCEGVVHTPKTELFDTNFDANRASYPVIIKPREGSGSRGIYLCHSPEELDRFTRDGSLLVQEYLPGEEYSVDVLLSQDGRAIAAVPRARLKVDSGVAVASRTVQDPDLQHAAIKAAQCVGLSGVVNVQLRRDALGRPALMEINPRFPGTMSLTIASGVDMPNLALLDILGESSWTHRLIPFRSLFMVRHWEEIYLNPNEVQTSGLTATACGSSAHH